MMALFRLCRSTQSSDSDTYAMFGCLYAYGFLLNLPHRDEFFGEFNDFVRHHFSLLCAEKSSGLFLNLKVSNLDGGNSHIRNFKANVAQTLNNAAVVVAMKMTMIREKCMDMVPRIISDSNFKEPFLLLTALNDLKMEWLAREVRNTVLANDQNVDLYLLLRQEAANKGDGIHAKIKHILETHEYKDIHRYFRSFCLEMKDNCDEDQNDIQIAQWRHKIINQHNLGYFLNKELLFVVNNKLTTYDIEEMGVSVGMLADQTVEFLIKERAWQLLQNIPYQRMETRVLAIMDSETSRLHRIHAMEAAVCFRRETWQSEAGHRSPADIDPKLAQFVSLERSRDYEQMRVFLEANLEYVDDASMTWLVERLDTKMLKVFFDVMKARNISWSVFDEKTGYELLKIADCQELDRLYSENLNLVVGARGIKRIVRAYSQDMLLYFSVMYISKYDMDLIDHLNDRRMLEYFAYGLERTIRDKDVIKRYQKSDYIIDIVRPYVIS